MQPIIQMFKYRHGTVVLALMLEFLHFSIWIDFGSPTSRSLMLIHLGLFLIWQPIWRGDEHISWKNSLTFFLLTIAFVIFLNWWLLFMWLILLSGFCGGRVVINRHERNTYMLVLVFLTSELIIECSAKLFNIPIAHNVRDLFGFTLPLLPLLIAALPVSKEGTSIQSVDILHALATSTLLSVLMFGSLLNMYLSDADYITALTQSLIAIALFLFAISWMLSPKAGFSGLSQLWSRALLNIGTPLEEWLNGLSNLSQQLRDPEEFLEGALEELYSLPWITGLQWQSVNSAGEFGKLVDYKAEFNTNNLSVSVHTNNSMGGALYLHCNLLVQLIENFYVGKIRERKLTQQTHLQAIHETGARVTHDIKNLLQSLQAITSIIEHEKNTNTGKSLTQKLLEKQLPHLTQRLQLALDKLQAPNQAAREMVYLKDWWQDLKQRYNQENITFQSGDLNDSPIPLELFDNVTENILENIREKTKIESDLKAKISLICGAGNIRLTICDDGKQIPRDQAKILLKEPVKSDNGLGIGLYQAARYADSMDFLLLLKNNEDGNVCFELTNSVMPDSLTTNT